MTQYGFIVQTIDVKPEADDAPANEVSKGLALGLNRLAQNASKGLKDLQGGGWEIASHSLTRVGKHMVVSMLIKREAPAAP